MNNSLYDRLLRRECGGAAHRSGIRCIYGSKEWVDDLDIVNELGGHTGCVNALCWSRSGQLLASGSDDHHLNIYSYQPDSSTAPFSLNTTVFTGHKANIFSVKFMPHSNDRTLITCAGDSQVRVFDIEHSGSSGNVAATSAFRASARSRRFNNFFTGARYLSEGNTNARVYRSHADRVKRIVTESSPYLFLTCSEDGEVRQWDLRQPSEAYPAPRGGQGFMQYRPGIEHDDSNVPPPLISYKRYHLDLNTISCSSSQPHYIALGGAHLHCFLHDRRMLGRDLLSERGQPGGFSPVAGSHDDALMGQATRCVRRFAPGGKKRMKGRKDSHITACKISDANPNEMVVSWSGDHIYSFDLIRSSDAREAAQTSERPVQGSSALRKRRSSRNRKRKRQNKASVSSFGSSVQHQSRRLSQEEDDSGDLSFRVRYGNGETGDIPISSLPDPNSDSPEDIIESARNSVLDEAQRLSMRIAKGLVKLRKALFSLEVTIRETTESSSEADPTPFTASFSAALTHASIHLPEMSRIIRTWAYPMNPTEEVVNFQQSLRRNRESAWKFVQAAGTLARVLGGKIQASSSESSTKTDPLDMFQQIHPAPAETDTMDPESRFGYDFLKAILLWLEGGREAVLRGFKRDHIYRRHSRRFPIPDSADESAIEEILVPYLQELAGASPVVNVDTSRFEHDSARILFPSQLAAVNAFANAVKLPLEELGNTAARAEGDGGSGTPNASNVRALDRYAAMRFWALKVGRGILMEAGSRVTFESVNRAFGGLRTTFEDGSDSEDEPERLQEDIDPNVEEEAIQDIRVVVSGGPSTRENHTSRESRSESIESASSQSALGEIGTVPEVSVSSSTINGDSEFAGRNFGNESDGSELEDEDDSDEDGEEDENDDDGDDDDMSLDESSVEDEDSEAEERFIRRSGLRKTRMEDVELDVPCSSHTRVYRGHCNIKTVKDVNFYGLNDEYVVSGSDSGHLFIWDRKTSDLVNILEGDSEVVNVVQGHPYEPTIAASGIDNTIKIFSTDRRAQEDARKGFNILDPENPANTFGSGVPGVGGLRSSKRIHDSYRIISQNDVDRQGGMSDAYLTRSMLARLAQTLRERETLGGGETTVVLEPENCNVM